MEVKISLRTRLPELDTNNIKCLMMSEVSLHDTTNYFKMMNNELLKIILYTMMNDAKQDDEHMALN